MTTGNILRFKTCNKAYVLANQHYQTATLGMESIGWMLKAQNYGTAISKQDDRDTILNNLQDYTLFYINTHASPTAFLDCVGQNNETSHFVYAYAPSEASDVTRAVYTGGSSRPKYQFVFLDGCNAAQADYFAKAFGITGSANRQDAALIGWNQTILLDRHNFMWRTRFLAYLCQGYTIDGAINEAAGLGKPHWKNRSTGQLISVKPVVRGDGKTKIHGAYGTPEGVDDWITVK